MGEDICACLLVLNFFVQGHFIDVKGFLISIFWIFYQIEFTTYMI